MEPVKTYDQKQGEFWKEKFYNREEYDKTNQIRIRVGQAFNLAHAEYLAGKIPDTQLEISAMNNYALLKKLVDKHLEQELNQDVVMPEVSQ